MRNKKIAGFVNIDIDIDASCRPDILGSVDNLDPYCDKDESVEEIVAFDIVEHFDRNTIKDVLNNWLRKLGKGGLLVVRTPDFDRIVSLYSRNGRRQGLLGLFGERFSFPSLKKRPGTFTANQMFPAWPTSGFLQQADDRAVIARDGLFKWYSPRRTSGRGLQVFGG